ncbi:MAG: type I-C CRISPR-associated protein Cas7/Csd2 [Ruminococcaceae bacterium]|nr:type I-C CRISPR-associated protein Cas7/Csd2 [Oscillospiraceae bacterium]
MENNIIKNRYEFVMIFDVENGNPNGDPDAGNMPRTDPETQYGIVTDVCLKRKIRNFVEIAKDGESGYGILVRADRALNSKFTEAYDALGLAKKQKGKNSDDVKAAQEYICKNYYDVRTFGAVMSTGDDPCGIVRGPVQINFARSIDPVYVQDITITRQAVTTESDFADKKKTEMGKKSFVPYGLYKAEGYVSALLAQKNADKEKNIGFSEEDLELLWTAIINMFENDHSAARGKMCMRKLYVFKHESALGNAPSHILFDKIKIEKKEGVVAPRSYDDYVINVDKEMPKGVELTEKI